MSWKVVSNHKISLKKLGLMCGILLYLVVEQSLVATAGAITEGKANSNIGSSIAPTSSNTAISGSNSNNSNSVGVPLTPTLEQV